MVWRVACVALASPAVAVLVAAPHARGDGAPDGPYRQGDAPVLEADPATGLPADGAGLAARRTEALVGETFGPEFAQAAFRRIDCGSPVAQDVSPSRPTGTVERACLAAFGSPARRWHVAVVFQVSSPSPEHPALRYTLSSLGPFSVAARRCPNTQRDRRPWSMTAVRSTALETCGAAAQIIGYDRIAERFRRRARLPVRFTLDDGGALPRSTTRYVCRTRGAARTPLVACENALGYRHEFRFRRIAGR